MKDKWGDHIMLVWKIKNSCVQCTQAIDYKGNFGKVIDTQITVVDSSKGLEDQRWKDLSDGYEDETYSRYSETDEKERGNEADCIRGLRSCLMLSASG